MIQKDYTQLSTDDLIRCFREENDERAFDQLLRSQYHLILGACLKYTEQEADAKDIATEVCTIVWKKLKTNKVENFNSWLFSVCKNRCMDFHRLHKKDNITYIEPETLEILADQNRIFEEEKEEKEDRPATQKEVEILINKLPDEQKICMRLFYLKKMSYNLIQSNTGFTFKQIKSSLQNGRRNLRKTINY